MKAARDNVMTTAPAALDQGISNNLKMRFWGTGARAAGSQPVCRDMATGILDGLLAAHGRLRSQVVHAGTLHAGACVALATDGAGELCDEDVAEAQHRAGPSSGRHFGVQLHARTSPGLSRAKEV